MVDVEPDDDVVDEAALDPAVGAVDVDVFFDEEHPLIAVTQASATTGPRKSFPPRIVAS